MIKARSPSFQCRLKIDTLRGFSIMRLKLSNSNYPKR